MAFHKLKSQDVQNDIVYVSAKELRQRTGVPKTTLHRHITVNHVDALRFGSRIFFTPQEAEKYERLFKCGLLR